LAVQLSGKAHKEDTEYTYVPKSTLMGKLWVL